MNFSISIPDLSIYFSFIMVIVFLNKYLKQKVDSFLDEKTSIKKNL
jgi:uncharacterized membrane protein (DUF485 family)